MNFAEWDQQIPLRFGKPKSLVALFLRNCLIYFADWEWIRCFRLRQFPSGHRLKNDALRQFGITLFGTFFKKLSYLFCRLRMNMVLSATTISLGIQSKKWCSMSIWNRQHFLALFLRDCLIYFADWERIWCFRLRRFPSGYSLFGKSERCSRSIWNWVATFHIWFAKRNSGFWLYSWRYTYIEYGRHIFFQNLSSCLEFVQE